MTDIIEGIIFMSGFLIGLWFLISNTIGIDISGRKSSQETSVFIFCFILITLFIITCVIYIIRSILFGG
jgi:hypothetical protein